MSVKTGAFRRSVVTGLANEILMYNDVHSGFYGRHALFH
jgi:hypothetical protein